jgi:hypothetical protein
MAIKLEYNLYFSTMKNENVNIDRKSLKREAETSLQFQYGHVSYKSFCKEYNFIMKIGFKENDRIDREATSISSTLWAIAYIIQHLAKAIIPGIPKVFWGQEKYLKAHIFHVCSDFEQLFGIITSLFFKKYGLYHIHKSQFHKVCYDYFLEKYTGENFAQPFSKATE